MRDYKAFPLLGERVRVRAVSNSDCTAKSVFEKHRFLVGADVRRRFPAFNTAPKSPPHVGAYKSQTGSKLCHRMP
jgi:hypothetical protein